MKNPVAFLLLLILTAVPLCGCGFDEPSLSGKLLQFETTDLSGNPVNSADLFAQHEITLLNLWGTWCGPCIQELPELNKVNALLADMDGAVVGLLHDGKGPNDVELAGRLLAENDISYLNILSPENMNEIILQRYYPTTIFVNREGVVVGRTLLGTPGKGYIVDYYVEAAKEALNSGN